MPKNIALSRARPNLYWARTKPPLLDCSMGVHHLVARISRPCIGESSGLFGVGVESVNKAQSIF